MKKTFKLRDLDCANCAAKMENAICKLEQRHRQLHDPEADPGRRRRPV